MTPREREIRERMARATPGPWVWRTPGYLCNKYIERGLVIPDHVEVSDYISGENKALIAHAPEDITYLLAQLTTAREIIEVTRAQLAEAERALKEIKVMSISSEAEQRRNGIFRDWKDISRDYFSKRGAR